MLIKDKTRMNDWATTWWRNYDNTLSRFDRIPECDEPTERQNCYGVSVCWSTIKMHTQKFKIPSLPELQCFNFQWHLTYSSITNIHFYFKRKSKHTTKKLVILYEFRNLKNGRLQNTIILAECTIYMSEPDTRWYPWSNIACAIALQFFSTCCW